MKGVVLAGGTGTRLRPFTHTMPKQMISIGGKPVLEHAIDKLRDAGITEIGVVLGETGHEAIQSYFGTGEEFSVDLTYIYQGEALGLGHAVGCTESFVDGDSFVLYLGDDILQHDISEFISQFNPEEYAGSIAVQPVDDPSRYCIVKTNSDGHIIGMIEKPSDPPTNLAGIGVFAFTPAIFDEIEHVEPSWRGEVELSDAIQRLLSVGEIFQSHVAEGWWYDVGTPEDVLAANRAVLDGLPEETRLSHDEYDGVSGRVSIGEDTEIESGAIVRGPVHLGARVTVESGSYIGPFSTIEDDCSIKGAVVESSVILQDATISCDARITDSIIGQSARVSESTQSGAGHRLLIGTDDEVSL